MEADTDCFQMLMKFPFWSLFGGHTLNGELNIDVFFVVAKNIWHSIWGGGCLLKFKCVTEKSVKIDPVLVLFFFLISFHYFYS